MVTLPRLTCGVWGTAPLILHPPLRRSVRICDPSAGLAYPSERLGGCQGDFLPGSSLFHEVMGRGSSADDAADRVTIGADRNSGQESGAFGGEEQQAIVCKQYARGDPISQMRTL